MKFILTSDWHLRERAPQARIDDYFVAQKKKLDFIFDLALKKDAIVLQAGDFFNSNPPSEYIKQFIINKIRAYEGLRILAVFGQHDMLHHSLKNLDRTGLAVLEAAEVVTILGSPGYAFVKGDVVVVGCHWGQEIPERKERKDAVEILVIHRMIIKEPLWLGQEADYGGKFLRKYSYDLIISGDNHQSFSFEDKNRYLYNPGSLMRSSAIQFEHVPQVGIYDTEERRLEVVEIPCAPADEVLSREHLEKTQERNERLEAFVESLKGGMEEVELDYRRNLQNFFERNEVKEVVKNLIWESMRYGKVR